VGQAGAILAAESVVWFDMVGLGSGSELEEWGRVLGLHPLALEDVVNTAQRPKVEPFDDHLFIVARMAHATGETEQVSLFLGDGWVLTIQERGGDCFEGIRHRLREASRRIRSRRADYLAYALLDSIVDSYFQPLDEIGAELETVENEVLEDPDAGSPEKIHRIRRRLVGLRKSIIPHRDAINSLIRDSPDVITEETGMFLRDVYDHVLRISDLVETYREMTADLMSVYLTVVSNRMNEIMKVLTIIATIFIPLGFVAGLYGMNFDPAASRWNMPELGWKFGYPMALATMLAVAGAMVVVFRRKKWF
jgi:magnesium transporter